MTNYFEKLNRENADQFINLLVDRFPDLAIATVKYWEKDGQVKRFYINYKEDGDDKSFNLNLTDRTIYVNDYEEIFWNQVVGLDSMMEFKSEVEKLVDEMN